MLPRLEQRPSIATQSMCVAGVGKCRRLMPGVDLSLETFLCREHLFILSLPIRVEAVFF